MADNTFSQHGTVMESRIWVSENRGKGVTCPACDRTVKEYSRPINKAQVLALVAMYASSGTSYVNVRDLKTDIRFGTADKNNEISKLAHWGLVQQHPSSKMGGTWRVTPLGARWLKDEVKVPRNVFIYQAECTGQGTELVTAADILGGGTEVNFDLRTIMRDISDDLKLSAHPSDPMYNVDTLYRRRSRKAVHGVPHQEDDEDSPLNFIGEYVTSVSHPLNHKIFYGDEPVHVARAWVYNNLGAGGYCPTCDRIAVYKDYPMKDSMARLLIEMYKHHGTEPVDVREFYLGDDLVDRNNYIAKIAQRDLVEESHPPRSDGVKAGWYRVTQAGVDWIFNRSLTPATVRSYNYYTRKGHSKHMVSVTDVLRDSPKWRYSELMQGLGVPDSVEPDLFEFSA